MNRTDLRMLGLALFASFAATTTASAGVPPAGFVENRGQWDTDSVFVSRLGGMVTRVEEDAIVVQLETGSGAGAIVRLSFEGAAGTAVLEGGQRRRSVCNFLIGDRSTWRRGVPCYDEVFYRGLYDGVDVRVYETRGQLEYDLLLAPGADLDQVVIRVDGIQGLEIEPDGALVMDTPLGPIRQTPPTTWYELPAGGRRAVESRFCKVDETRYGFEVPDPDPALPLVIDPALALEWSTFLGGSSHDSPSAVVVDEQGVLTVCGWTTSLNFPTLAGAYDESYNGAGPFGFGDAFVARLDPGQSGADQLVWSTYLGGAGDENLVGVALDSDGTVVLGGWTSSSDFPTTQGAYDETFNGVSDVVAVRLSANGETLLWSTVLGGSGCDFSGLSRTVVLDGSGMVTLTGYTYSSDFPTTSGALDEIYNGSGDCFIARLDPSQDGQNQLVYSTYLGGSGEEGGSGIAVDSAGVVTVGGWSNSDDLPATAGSYDETYNGAGAQGGGDAFLARLDLVHNGTGDLLYLTYLGGTSDEGINSLVIDDAGVVTVTGSVSSGGFPATTGVYDETFNGPDWDAFVSRLSLDGEGSLDLVYSTFMGGATGYDFGFDVALDDSGAVNVTGVTRSSDFPTHQAYDGTWNGLEDIFVVRLRLDAAGLNDMVSSTYLGGSSWDVPRQIAADVSDVVVVGDTRSTNFPTTPGAFDETHNSPGLRDAFAVRIDMCQWDVNDNGDVGINDFLDLLAAWGPNPGHPADFDGDGQVGITDFLALLANWGPCP